jgi:predicted MFS family arabinose efflux permease
VSGLLFGILFARPVASSLGGLAGWRSVFGCAAVITTCAAGVLWHRLPSWRPAGSASYGSLLRSLWSVFATHRALRKRALSQAALFGTFSLFWTAVPWLLIAQGYSQHDIALFALAGAGGALVAPWAGRMADRGHTRKVSIGAMLLVAVAFGAAIHGSPLWLMVVAAIALDAGIQANHVVGQREVLSLDAAATSRLNSVYMGVFFAGGAAASSAAGPLFRHGWPFVAAAGALLALLALAVYLGLDAREGGPAV